MSKRDLIEVAVSVLGGAGIGAGLMYLLDPDKGGTRRDHLRENLGDAASATGEALGASWQTVSGKAKQIGSSAYEYGGAAVDKAKDWGGSVADSARDAGHYLADRAGRLTSGAGAAASDAGDWLGNAHDTASGWGKTAAKSARGYGRSALRGAQSFAGYNQGPSAASIGGITAGVVGALALGAGIMFLFDPAQGRRRRSMIRETATDYGRRTAGLAQDAATGVANQARGVAEKVSSAVQQVGSKITGSHADATGAKLVETVRKAVNTLGNDFKEVAVNEEGGRIALSGSVSGSHVDQLLTAIRKVQGVQGIDNRLRVQTGVA